MTPNDPDHEAMQAANKTAMDKQAILSSSVPEAKEPLSPERVNVLSETMITAMEALSGRQVSEQPIAVESDVTKLPDRMYAQLAAVAGILDQVPGAEAYRFDPTQTVQDNEGLAQAISKIGQAGRDKKVIRAVASTVPQEHDEAAEPSEEEAGPPEDDIDDYIASDDRKRKKGPKGGGGGGQFTSPTSEMGPMV